MYGNRGTCPFSQSIRYPLCVPVLALCSGGYIIKFIELECFERAHRAGQPSAPHNHIIRNYVSHFSHTFQSRKRGNEFVFWKRDGVVRETSTVIKTPATDVQWMFWEIHFRHFLRKLNLRKQITSCCCGITKYCHCIYANGYSFMCLHQHYYFYCILIIHNFI